VSPPPPEFDISEEDAAVLAGSELASKIKQLAVEELLRRLEDPDEARKLAATGLLNLVNQILKNEEKQAARDQDGPNEVTDPIAAILEAPLPTDRKLQQFDTLRNLYMQQIGKVEDEQLLLRRQAEPERGVLIQERDDGY
jgi:hypothetical protein